MKARNLLIIFILIYVGSFIYLLDRALNLEFNGELIALLPSENNHLSSYKKLEDLNSSEGGFTLIIHSTNGESVVDKAYEITDRLITIEREGNQLFRSAELENDLYDIRYSALYLMTENELDDLLTEIDEFFIQKKREANPIYFELEEENETELNIGNRASVLLEEVSNARRYSMNEDSTIISVLFLANFPRSDFNQVESAYLLLQEEKAVIENEYPNLELHWGGAYVNHYFKINDVTRSVSTSVIIGGLCLIVFLVLYMIFVNRKTGYKVGNIFADLALIFFVLFSGFGISIGLSSFLFHEINVFTGIIFSILFGINLDYILHLYAANKERPLDASSIPNIIASYLRSTKPILLSCLTTGLAIMSLVFAEFQGFIQFGIIFFINIMVNLFSTYMFLLLSPSLAKTDLEEESSETYYDSFFTTLNKQGRRYGLLALICIIAADGYFGSQSLEFNYNFRELEPRTSTTSFRALNSEMNNGTRYFEPSYFITENIAQSKDLFEEIQNGIGTTYPDIERVESFSARYPSNPEEFESKSVKIESIQQLLDDNNEFLKTANPETSEFIQIARNTVPPTIETLPKYIKNRFFFKDGTIAPMVAIYPTMNLSHGQRSINFRKSSGEISTDSGEVFYAASTYIIASTILELLIQEFSFLFFVPLITILVLLLIYYRSFLKALLAATPLLLTFGILLSIQTIFPFEINLYNLIVFPIIIGVGADNGIHLVDSLIKHRKDFIQYFVHKKFPILAACSFTTVLGFIGLLFIDHPGMESIGVLAVVGISTTLCATYLTSLLVQTFVLKS